MTDGIQSPWADAQLSLKIPDIQIAGEGQHIEFKRELDTDDVRREIAAFATAGGGRLFVGIDDAGVLYGLSTFDATARDQLAHRLQGIARSVAPAVNFSIAFAVVDQQVIACVYVAQKQDHPVFYSNQKPYIRDGRTTRPAEPDEVVECVLNHPIAAIERERQQLRLKQDQDFVEQISRMREAHPKNVSAYTTTYCERCGGHSNNRRRTKR